MLLVTSDGVPEVETLNVHAARFVSHAERSRKRGKMRAASETTRESLVAFDWRTVLLRHEQAASRERSHVRRELLNLE